MKQVVRVSKTCNVLTGKLIVNYSYYMLNTRVMIMLVIYRDSGDSYTEIVFGNISTFYESGFDVNKTTKILIHGWRGSAFSTFATELRQSESVDYCFHIRLDS